MCPLLKPVKVLLHGISSLHPVNCTTQLGVVSKLAEGALNPTVSVTNKNVKQCCSQYQPLRNATRYWSLPVSLVKGVESGKVLRLQENIALYMVECDLS